MDRGFVALHDAVAVGKRLRRLRDRPRAVRLALDDGAEHIAFVANDVDPPAERRQRRHVLQEEQRVRWRRRQWLPAASAPARSRPRRRRRTHPLSKACPHAFRAHSNPPHHCPATDTSNASASSKRMARARPSSPTKRSASIVPSCSRARHDSERRQRNAHAHDAVRRRRRQARRVQQRLKRTDGSGCRPRRLDRNRHGARALDAQQHGGEHRSDGEHDDGRSREVHPPRGLAALPRPACSARAAAAASRNWARKRALVGRRRLHRRAAPLAAARARLASGRVACVSLMSTPLRPAMAPPLSTRYRPPRARFRRASRRAARGRDASASGPCRAGQPSTAAVSAYDNSCSSQSTSASRYSTGKRAIAACSRSMRWSASSRSSPSNAAPSAGMSSVQRRSRRNRSSVT